MHKGVNARWKDSLTPEDIEHYEQGAREKLGSDIHMIMPRKSYITAEITLL